MRRGARIALTLFFLLAGCSEDKGKESEADLPSQVETVAEAGAAEVFADEPGLPEVAAETAAPEVLADESEAAFEVSPPEKPGLVLLLDFEMRHPVSWKFAIEKLEALGHAVTYRRYYPHVTLADVSPDEATGKLRYPMIFVSTGNAPSEPSERMRAEDAENLVQYLAGGGTLLLLIRNTWQDGYGGDSEWVFFNRVLEAAGLPIRIPRNTGIGFVNQSVGGKPPQHIQVEAGYPGALEWTLNYPTAFPAADHPATAGLGRFAAGVTSTVTCDGDQVEVLAWTHKNILVWKKLDQSADSIVIPLAPQPLAVVAATGAGGAVAVLPRSVLQLPVHTEYMSDKPVLDLSLLDATEAFAAAALTHLSDLSRGLPMPPPKGCHVLDDFGLFSASGTGLAPLGDGEVVNALYPPSLLDVPDSPPEPPAGAPGLEEALPAGTPAEPTGLPDWYSEGRARFGWGGLRPYEEMKGFLQKGVDSGFDCFIVGADSQWLVDYYEGDLPEPPPFAEAAKAAEETGASLFLGVNWLTAKYGDLKPQIGQAVGAHGQVIEAPPPLADLYWEEAIRPMYLGAAVIAADYPSIKGLNIDMELYGAGQLWYSQGFAFDDGTWARLAGAIGAVSPELAEAANGCEPPDRLPWLVDNGLAGLAFSALEEATAAKVASIREDAEAINPDVEFTFYGVMVSTAWFYRGWMKGLGTVDKPVTHLSYDIATNRARQVFNAEGIHVRILGGLLGVLFAPEDAGTGLANAGLRSDGYWLFQFTDFPYQWDPANPPKLNGTPDAYWAAFEQANALLDDAPLDP